MIKPIAAILISSSLLGQPAQRVDWMNDVASAYGCKRDGLDNGPTVWHCAAQRHPIPDPPNPPLIQWHQTAPLLQDETEARNRPYYNGRYRDPYAAGYSQGYPRGR